MCSVYLILATPRCLINMAKITVADLFFLLKYKGVVLIKLIIHRILEKTKQIYFFSICPFKLAVGLIFLPRGPRNYFDFYWPVPIFKVNQESSSVVTLTVKTNWFIEHFILYSSIKEEIDGKFLLSNRCAKVNNTFHPHFLWNNFSPSVFEILQIKYFPLPLKTKCSEGLVYIIILKPMELY